MEYQREVDEYWENIAKETVRGFEQFSLPELSSIVEDYLRITPNLNIREALGEIGSQDHNRIILIYTYAYINERRRRDGPHVTWSVRPDTGKLTLVEKNFWRDGLLEGTQIKYHENGKKALEKNYENGIINGPYLVWYDNGRLQLQFYYHKGKKDGLQLEMNPDGTIRKLESYKSGELTGTRI